jgi:hypothetical protein
MITASRRAYALLVAPILLQKPDITMRLGSRRDDKLAGWKSPTGGRIEPAVSSSEARYRADYRRRPVSGLRGTVRRRQLAGRERAALVKPRYQLGNLCWCPPPSVDRYSFGYSVTPG